MIKKNNFTWPRPRSISVENVIQTYPAASVPGMLQNYTFPTDRARARPAGRGTLCFPGWVTVGPTASLSACLSTLLLLARPFPFSKIQRTWRKSGRVKSVDVNVNPTRNSICIQRRRKLDYFVIGFVRSFVLSVFLSFSPPRTYHSLRLGCVIAVLATSFDARESGSLWRVCVRLFVYVTRV